MQLPKVTEVRGIRVLTTRQISEMYGTTRQIISFNFNHNKAKFQEGKHYIILTGQALKDFKASHENHDNLKFAHIAYLWTEKGALLHAKSVNTDKAWEVYDYLVDFYFRAKEEKQEAQKKEVVPVNAKDKQVYKKRIVDIPASSEIQKAINEANDCIIALQVALKEYNACRSEGSFKDHFMTVNNTMVAATSKVLNVLEIGCSVVKI